MAFEILTDRLRLVAWKMEYLDSLAMMNADPEVMRYFPAPATRDQSRELILRQQKMFEDNGFCFFPALLRSAGEFAGFIGLSIPRFEADFTPCVEIGWRLHKHLWGAGLATEGARACIDFAQNQDIADCIYAFTPHQNRSSRRVMEKLGMLQVGSFLHPHIESGHPLQDLALYKIEIQ